MSDNRIKSFEISDDAEVGDIVSKGKKAKRGKLKVGLLCLGWFEWWPMFPDSNLETKIKEDAKFFISEMNKRFGEIYEFVAPEFLVDTLDGAFDCGELFNNRGVEAVIVVESTYLTDFIPIEALDHLPKIPTIIFAAQATKNLWSTMKNTDVIRYEGLVGNAQLVGAFKKMGRDYKIVVGALDDENSYKGLSDHLKTINLVKDLKALDIGLLGHTFRGMYDIEIDKTKVKGAFGPNVLYLDVTHLINLWKKVTDKEIDEFIAQLEKDIPISSAIVTDEDRRKSVALGIAVQKLINKFGVDALTLLGQHHVEVATRASADFSFYCAEKLGIMTTHEGDIANLVMKYIMKYISGKLPVFLEWTAFDEKSNSLLLTHHGVVDPVEHAADLSKARWTPSPEKWDFTGNGYSCEYVAKPGKVTLASLINELGTWKLLISQGECIVLDQNPCFAPQFYFQPENTKVTKYIEDILVEGVAHHICLVYGDYKKELELVADYLNVPKVII
jgi:L-arabinose isomerase